MILPDRQLVRVTSSSDLIPGDFVAFDTALINFNRMGEFRLGKVMKLEKGKTCIDPSLLRQAKELSRDPFIATVKIHQNGAFLTICTYDSLRTLQNEFHGEVFHEIHDEEDEEERISRQLDYLKSEVI